MSSPEISEDDEGLSDIQLDADQYSTLNSEDIVDLCSEDETDTYYTSDEDLDLPAVNLAAKKSAIIKNLFSEPSTSTKQEKYYPKNIPSCSKQKIPVPVYSPEKPKDPGIIKMIGGVKINLPVKPYPSQIALMAQIITAIKKRQNCLLESPTGSGKTLALLCGALAWQHQERNRMSQTAATHYVSSHPEITKVDGAKEYLASPPRKHLQEISFANVTHGDLSIYDKPMQNGCGDNTPYNTKRQEPDKCCDSPSKGQVTIHKKRRLNGDESKTSSPELPSTPEKIFEAPQPETPQGVRNLYGLIDSLHLRTSMFIDCSLPTIYYGARTHKQLQQVIKEFARTFYCGEAAMTVLSSREYSCIREFDKQLWGNKNDMCRGCTKRVKPVGDTPKPQDGSQTNCKFYDNRQALNRANLPAAFDLDELVETGHELMACPYYGARAMAQDAQIVFCPYNYLIEPGIRNSMQIDLRDNIVIIDEAHNIEDICRDAATFTFTKDGIEASVKELDALTGYRFKNEDLMDYVMILLRALKNWGDWFSHQLPLINSKPVMNNEAVHVWEMDPFVQTLNNHNIGEPHFNDFSGAAQIFTRRYREDPQTLFGITQATSNLIESMDTVFGYLFGDDGKHKNDFKPVLVRTVYGSSDALDAKGWRSSQFNKSKASRDKWIDKETLSLRLMCMSPAVVFSSVTKARCVLLASGTLTPLVSLHSELGTEFPLQISPNHVISSDRVWIGTLTTCPNGRPLECNSRATSQCDIQDALGETVRWVSQVTPHGVLCFLPNYALLNKLVARWQETGLWHKLLGIKHVFMESRNVKDHNDIMEDYYKYASSGKGALLFAVYRGKVSEGMDFKDQQARAVITVGIPYPNMHDLAVKQKMIYNDKYASQKKLLPSNEWLRVQAFRALNQAVGRCVRHAGDWGAVLLVDARFTQPYYTHHLSKWVKNFLGNNHHTFESLVNSPNSLESFMQNMTIRESEDI